MSLENIAYLVGIVATITGGVYFVVKKLNERKIYYRQKLQESWTNESDVTNSTAGTHYINLELSTDLDSGEITGLIDVRNTETNIELKNLSVNGKLNCRKGNLIIGNVVRDGKYEEYGRIKIKIDRYGKNLTWTKKSGDSNYLPLKTILW